MKESGNGDSNPTNLEMQWAEQCQDLGDEKKGPRFQPNPDRQDRQVLASPDGCAIA
jgi:hypothetical protein